jgi:non-homologous end joining protein Ku
MDPRRVHQRVERSGQHDQGPEALKIRATLIGKRCWRINAQNFVAAFQQAIAKVRSNKSDEDTTFGQHTQALREKQAASPADLVSIIRVSLVPNL